MSKKSEVIVFDTQAILYFYLGEQGSEAVQNYLTSILEDKIEGYINVINLAEMYYILSRIDNDTADEKERNLVAFGVQPIFDNSKIWKRAARIKAGHSLSLADAFAAATAIQLDGKLVTGADVEFDGVKELKVEHL
jgi:predicted nucleic acid-binding protein